MEPGSIYAADLDGDGESETIVIEAAGASLTISDEKMTYRSRDKWQVVDACVADSDQDGLPEIVALLDADDGRHLGLFAFFGGQYRERFVSGAIRPPPLALEVIDARKVLGADDPTSAYGPSGDIVVLVRRSAAHGAGLAQTLLRWNGFGFTSIALDMAR
jgi:hypothetical protein